MQKLFIFIFLFIFFLPLEVFSSERKKKETYIAKSKKSVKYKKKRRTYIRYPVRVNSPSAGEKIKLYNMLKDIYE